jgi:hypothetical protein
MRTLDLKLLRELRRHWVQVTSIALVMGCGTMTIMGLRSTLTSIRPRETSTSLTTVSAMCSCSCNARPTRSRTALRRSPG